jgi:hypothetical protein
LQSAWASGDPMERCTKSSRYFEFLLRGCCAPARVEHSAGHRYYAAAPNPVCAKAPSMRRLVGVKARRGKVNISVYS